MQERLLQILKEKAFEQKKVTLASGRESQFYIDVKRVSLSAEGAFLLGKLLYKMMVDHFPEAVGAGGLTLGADPLATSLAIASFEESNPKEAFIVRKESKGYGLDKFIEGGLSLAPGSPVVVLEDVVTSGKSSIEACRRVSHHGWKVLGVLAVVDRQEGGLENLQKEGIPLVSLFTKSNFGIVE